MPDTIIITPSLTTGYSYINIFDYDAASEASTKVKDMNVLTIAPELKLTGNFGDGWQPYMSVAHVWSIGDKAKVTVDGEAIDSVSSKPYFEYALGLSKDFGKVMSDLELVFRTGGREGVALKADFRF